MFKKFLKEDKAQGAIEYILLAGGIIVASLIITVIYRNMVKSTRESVGGAVNEAAAQIARGVNQTNILSGAI